jgi:hypothetical protein
VTVEYDQKTDLLYLRLDPRSQQVTNQRVAEALESLHGGPIGFLSPELSLPVPDWK